MIVMRGLSGVDDVCFKGFVSRCEQKSRHVMCEASESKQCSDGFSSIRVYLLSRKGERTAVVLFLAIVRMNHRCCRREEQ